MNKWSFLTFFSFIFFVSCGSDDDGISQGSQNEIDDEAIVQYLEDHYFDSDKGKIAAYEDGESSSEEKPSLYSSAKKLPSGVWIAKRAGVTETEEKVTDNLKNSILISFEAFQFKASKEDLSAKNGKLYSPVYSYGSTINTSGQATYDPLFYYVNIDNYKNVENIKREHFEIEGFIEGIKEFGATGTSGADDFNFQGVIIVPSRLAFERELIYTSENFNYGLRDCSFVFSFELHKVVQRENTSE